VFHVRVAGNMLASQMAAAVATSHVLADAVLAAICIPLLIMTMKRKRSWVSCVEVLVNMVNKVCFRLPITLPAYLAGKAIIAAIPLIANIVSYWNIAKHTMPHGRSISVKSSSNVNPSASLINCSLDTGDYRSATATVSGNVQLHDTASRGEYSGAIWQALGRIVWGTHTYNNVMLLHSTHHQYTSWTIRSVGMLSTDVYVRYVTLLLFRWEAWIILLFSAVFTCVDTDTSMSGFIVELLLLVMEICGYASHGARTTQHLDCHLHPYGFIDYIVDFLCYVLSQCIADAMAANYTPS
jgi:hypothetical protein